MKEIDLAYASIENREGILWLIIKDDAELDVKEIKELTSICEKAADYQPYILMTDARVNVSITSDARKASASKEICPLIVANAVLVNNIAVRMVANFFTNVNKPHFKHKVFNEEQEALAWLTKQI